MPPKSPFPTDLTGLTFGRLVVVERSPVSKRGSKVGNRAHWLCRCECGGTTITPRHNLVSGKCQSCGCRNKELAASRASERKGWRKEQARYRMPEYAVWRAMNARCGNESVHNYGRYGGRGIRVCKRWRSDFDSFMEDMGRRPSASHTIERVDVDGDYCPENCIWLESWKQSWNTSNTKLSPKKVEVIRERRNAGEKLQSIADDFGVHVSMVSLVALGKCWREVGDVARKDRER